MVQFKLLQDQLQVQVIIQWAAETLLHRRGCECRCIEHRTIERVLQLALNGGPSFVVCFQVRRFKVQAANGSGWNGRDVGRAHHHGHIRSGQSVSEAHLVRPLPSQLDGLWGWRDAERWRSEEQLVGPWKRIGWGLNGDSQGILDKHLLLDIMRVISGAYEDNKSQKSN